jgi:hypothetical protein
MKMHLNNGQLRAFLDGEAKPDEIRHVGDCLECQKLLGEIQKQVTLTGQHLGFLNQPTGNCDPSSLQALAKFKTYSKKNKEIPLMKRLIRPPLRSLTIGLAVILILVVTLSVPQMRAWAGQFLGLFRVQQVTVLPIDNSIMSQLTGNSALGSKIGDLLSDSVTITQKPGENQTVTDVPQASLLAGFTVRLPSSESATPILTLEDSLAFQFDIDLQKVQAILTEAGRSDLVLPDSLEGATIKVSIPSAINAAYGSCSSVVLDESGDGSESNDSTLNSDCIIVMEIPSPTVNTPPDIDLTQLAILALEFTGMDAEQAQSFAQTIDWTTSLVVPIPENAATYEQVSVDGVTGVLIQSAPDEHPEYILIWVKDGIIYTIAAENNDTTTAINMANSMN